jgi:hypothetical protein
LVKRGAHRFPAYRSGGIVGDGFGGCFGDLGSSAGGSGVIVGLAFGVGVASGVGVDFGLVKSSFGSSGVAVGLTDGLGDGVGVIRGISDGCNVGDGLGERTGETVGVGVISCSLVKPSRDDPEPITETMTDPMTIKIPAERKIFLNICLRDARELSRHLLM